nr:MAG TPA: Replication initiation and membrane attachment [Caudoviricetes sp.]
MGQNKKYYWLKLKENFFEEKQIKYLRSLPDGDKIVIAYLKMQLKSLKTEGFIKYDSILPSNIDELAMILDENTNIIKLMIGALQKVNAVEILDDGSFYMIAMQDLIGKEGESAERVRRFRERQEQKLLQCNGDVTKCNIEIETEKEKEIEKEKNAEIIKCYEENIGLITPATAEILFSYNDIDYKMIIEAIKIASINNKRNCKYIQGILNSWIRKGYKVVADIQKEQEEKENLKGNEEHQETKEERIARLKKEWGIEDED